SRSCKIVAPPSRASLTWSSKVAPFNQVRSVMAYKVSCSGLIDMFTASLFVNRHGMLNFGNLFNLTSIIEELSVCLTQTCRTFFNQFTYDFPTIGSSKRSY